MKKSVLLTLMTLFAINAWSQETYDAMRFATSDLNGSARYVGMGGALSALGGDVAVMSDNPAAIGLFSKSDASFTVSGVFGSKGTMGHDGGRASIDNGGIVLSSIVKESSGTGLLRVNYGVNFKKKHNYLYNLDKDIAHLNGIFSQSFQIAKLGNDFEDGYYDELNGIGDFANPEFSQNGDLVHGGATNASFDDNGNFLGYEGVAANQALLQKAQFGGENEVDVAVAFNISNQVFLGASVGFYDINYSRDSYYEEVGVDGLGYGITTMYDTDGDGVDVKFGAVLRPIEESPFRIGLSVKTPIWYSMHDVNGAILDFYDVNGKNEGYVNYNGAEVDYNFQTPWKFGLSMGYTVGNYLALGAEWEFADLSTSKYKMSSHSDYFDMINDWTKDALKMQHTFKAGIEIKPTEQFSIRFGYNFVTAPIKDDAYRLVLADDYMSTETYYTNWKGTNRFTCGLGYRYKGGYIDLAYQYNTQKCDLYAFDDVDLKPTEVNFNRHQLMGTIGFRF